MERERGLTDGRVRKHVIIDKYLVYIKKKKLIKQNDDESSINL